MDEVWIVEYRSKSLDDWGEWELDWPYPDVRKIAPTDEVIALWNSLSSRMQYRVRKFVAAEKEQE